MAINSNLYQTIENLNLQMKLKNEKINELKVKSDQKNNSNSKPMSQRKYTESQSRIDFTFSKKDQCNEKDKERYKDKENDVPSVNRMSN